MSTPFQVVAAAERVRPTSKAKLLAISRDLERRALADPPALITATLQDARYVTARTRQVYRCLADAGVRVTLLARGLTSWVAPGVEGVALDEEDPLVHEWVLVAPVPGDPTVLVATDLAAPDLDDLDRSFEYAVSHDGQVVEACTRLLVGAGRR